MGRLFVRTILAAAALCAVPAAFADAWPDHPVRIVYPFPPGGSDGAVRLLAEHLTKALGQPVIVENKGGAGGNVGAQAVAASEGDGYTFLMGTNGPLVINPMVYKDMTFDPQRDFVSVSGFVRAPQVLFVHPSVPAHNAAELVALAKANPGKLTYASVGQGSASHLTMELLKSIAGVDIVHVPYKGAGPAITDVIAGRVNMMTVIAAAAMPYVRAGKVRAIGITSATPSPVVPGVPPLGSSGIAGVEALAWLALVAPKGTSAPILERMNAETGKFLKEPAVAKRLLDFGFETWYTSRQELEAQMRREAGQWAKVIKSIDLRLD